MTGVADDNRFPKSSRVRTRREFDHVFASKVYAADSVLVINAGGNTTGRSRLGLAVSKNVGNAVVRNRWKRLIREAFRRQAGELPTNIDLVIRPRRGADPDLPAIARSLAKLARRCAQRVRSEQ